MTLATHAVVGSAIASLVPTHPVIGFCAGFLSHFLLDSIPHWDYPLKSDSINPSKGGALKLDKNVIIDLSCIGFDIGLGLAFSIAFFISNAPFLPIIIGACAGIIPDVLQFVYSRYPKSFLKYLQAFHLWMHAETNLNNRPVLGVSLQALLIVIVVIACKFFLLA
jgi:hypothetical protein